MHFLKKITENPTLEDPAKEHMDVHRHFYRYSRGEFIGPAIKLRQTSTKFTLKGSLEFEDLVQELVLRSLSTDELEIDGTLISGQDISDKLNEFDINWELKESTGKTKNYKASFEQSIETEKLLDLVEEFRKCCYLLLNFQLEKWVRVDTKSRLPKPSKKKPIDDDVGKRVQFCKGYMNSSDQNNQMIMDEVVFDFKDEIPEDWSKITLTNNYRINEIAIPRGVKDSRKLRILAVRKGKLIRTVDIDGEIIEKQYSFVV
ncbi:MAG: hypothetical protein GF311_06260 [Candidatus Lokiarchaeota archaeon]|nr:hypothetical protein [Candidatus Lokiarchaeota archaeon]